MACQRATFAFYAVLTSNQKHTCHVEKCLKFDFLTYLRILSAQARPVTRLWSQKEQVKV